MGRVMEQVQYFIYDLCQALAEDGSLLESAGDLKFVCPLTHTIDITNWFIMLMTEY